MMRPEQVRMALTWPEALIGCVSYTLAPIIGVLL